MYLKKGKNLFVQGKRYLVLKILKENHIIAESD